jgi:trans-aconitate methyltransferase
VIDIGCGDFSVGELLLPAVGRYRGFDISRVIIEANRRRFADVRKASFDVFDITSDDLPETELLLVRQVFQHLTNAQVEQALCRIEAARPRRVLITEHVCRPGSGVEMNRDLPSHSVITRVSARSGIDIGRPPFDRPRKVLALLEPGVENLAEPNSVLCVYEMRFD